jgi:AbiV family abortive infection protein
MTRPVPSHDDLVTLLQACLDNAGDLLADARLLLDADRAPRAHALATLAFEEIGKACICLLALLPMPEPFFGFRGADDFWAAWNSHTDKLAWARGFLTLLMSEPTGPAQEAAVRVIDAAGADHLRKMRGLYVDYLAGTVLLPENITATEARELTADVQAVLDVVVHAWCHDQVRDRLGEVQQQHGAELADLMVNISQVVQTDPDTAVALGRRMLQEGLSGESPSGG